MNYIPFGGITEVKKTSDFHRVGPSRRPTLTTR